MRTFLATLALIYPVASGGCSSSPGTGAPSASDNGCTLAAAEVHTKDTAAVEIQFGGTLGNRYSPACVIVNKGQSVIFSGNFASHPLQAGTVDNDGAAHPVSGSPISSQKTGMTATVQIAEKGTFPFYCIPHAGAGMKGVIFAK